MLRRIIFFVSIFVLTVGMSTAQIFAASGRRLAK